MKSTNKPVLPIGWLQKLWDERETASSSKDRYYLGIQFAEAVVRYLAVIAFSKKKRLPKGGGSITRPSFGTWVDILRTNSDEYSTGVYNSCNALVAQRNEVYHGVYRIDEEYYHSKLENQKAPLHTLFQLIKEYKDGNEKSRLIIEGEKEGEVYFYNKLTNKNIEYLSFSAHKSKKIKPIDYQIEQILGQSDSNYDSLTKNWLRNSCEVKGRESDLATLSEQKDLHSRICITGVPGIGKSSLLAALFRRLRQSEQIHTFVFPFQCSSKSHFDFEKAFKAFYKKIFPESSNFDMDEIWNDVKTRTNKSSFFILLDSIDESELIDLDKIPDSANVRIIYTTRIFHNHLAPNHISYELDPLNENDIKDIFHEKINERISRDARETFFKNHEKVITDTLQQISSGNPFFVHMFAEYMIRHRSMNIDISKVESLDIFFQELIGNIPEETRNFIPDVLACLAVCKEPINKVVLRHLIRVVREDEENTVYELSEIESLLIETDGAFSFFHKTFEDWVIHTYKEECEKYKKKMLQIIEDTQIRNGEITSLPKSFMVYLQRNSILHVMEMKNIEKRHLFIKAYANTICDRVTLQKTPCFPAFFVLTQIQGYFLDQKISDYDRDIYLVKLGWMLVHLMKNPNLNEDTLAVIEHTTERDKKWFYLLRKWEHLLKYSTEVELSTFLDILFQEDKVNKCNIQGLADDYKKRHGLSKEQEKDITNKWFQFVAYLRKKTDEINVALLDRSQKLKIDNASQMKKMMLMPITELENVCLDNMFQELDSPNFNIPLKTAVAYKVIPIKEDIWDIVNLWKKYIKRRDNNTFKYPWARILKTYENNPKKRNEFLQTFRTIYRTDVYKGEIYRSKARKLRKFYLGSLQRVNFIDEQYQFFVEDGYMEKTDKKGWELLIKQASQFGRIDILQKCYLLCPGDERRTKILTEGLYFALKNSPQIQNQKISTLIKQLFDDSSIDDCNDIHFDLLRENSAYRERVEFFQKLEKILAEGPIEDWLEREKEELRKEFLKVIRGYGKF